MNRKQLSILLVLLVVVGLAGLMVYRKQNESTGSTSPFVGKKVLGDFAINDVAAIRIQHSTNTVNLVKKNDRWRVQERGDYPANYSEISQFIIKLNDAKVVQSEEVGPSQLGRLWLAPGPTTNTAVTVEFLNQAGVPIKTVLLGKKHMRKSNRPSPMGEFGDEGWPDGRYVMVGTNAKSVALISEPFANVEPKPEYWVSKDFFRVEKPKSIAVTFPEATNSWKLVRESESAQWTLVEAKPEEKLDSSKVSGVTYPFSSPTFNDILVGANPELVGMDRPTVVNIETFDQFAYIVKVGTKTNDTYPLTVEVQSDIKKERTPGADEKPEDKEKLDKEFQEKVKKQEEKLAQEKAYANNIYLVSAWSVDSLLKKRHELLAQGNEANAETGTETESEEAHVHSDTDVSDLETVLEPE